MKKFIFFFVLISCASEESRLADTYYSNKNYIKAMSNLIIKKEDYNFNGELSPPKIQCPNQFVKCPCLNYE